MTFEDLLQFARTVTSALATKGPAPSPGPNGQRGWLLDSTDMAEATEYGGSPLEMRFDRDEVWLLEDGQLLVVHARRTSVVPRGGSPREETSSRVESLTESYARERDGKERWERWTDQRGGGVSVDEGGRFFDRPTADQPPFHRVSGWLTSLSGMSPRGY